MSFEDYEARAAARDQAPPEFAGVDPAAVAEWAVHGGSTPAQNAIATKVNPIIESVQADEEAAQTPEWEADSTYFDESGAGVPELDPYSPTFAEDVKGYTEQQIAAALQPYAGDAEVEAWYADYQQRQQAWREEAAQAQWQENERLLNAASQHSANEYDAKQAFQSGKIRENMAEGYAALREGLIESGATPAEADQTIFNHYGSDEILAEHLGAAAAIAARNEAISARIFNGPGWNRRTR
jgi:hypothetical protein